MQLRKKVVLNEDQQDEIETLMKVGGPVDKRLTKHIDREIKFIEMQQGSETGSVLAIKAKQYTIVEEITETDEKDSVSVSSGDSSNNSDHSFRVQIEEENKTSELMKMPYTNSKKKTMSRDNLRHDS